MNTVDSLSCPLEFESSPDTSRRSTLPVSPICPARFADEDLDLVQDLDLVLGLVQDQELFEDFFQDVDLV